MAETYVVDITQPPHSFPERKYNTTLLGERETISSRREVVEFERYITAYNYMQAIEERKNNVSRTK